MGKFDDQIAWCRERRDEARKSLEKLEEGLSHFDRRDDGEWIEITESLKEELRDDIAEYERLIKAYWNA